MEAPLRLKTGKARWQLCPPTWNHIPIWTKFRTFFTFFQKNIGFDGTKTEGAGKKLYRRNDSHALFWIVFRENDENMGKTGD